jgi:hypothetical protein
MTTSTPPINARFPLIVVKRVYYEQFAAGTKTIEYRRHRKPFTKRAFYVGRWVRLAYSYNINKYPSLIARVTEFELAPARDHPAMRDIYPDLADDDELALIHLDVHR